MVNYSEHLSNLLTGRLNEDIIKGSATKDQLEALSKAGEAYAKVDRSNVGAKTQEVVDRHNHLLKTAQEKRVAAEVEAKQAAEALKSARDAHAAELKKVQEKLAADIDIAHNKAAIQAAEERVKTLAEPAAKTDAVVLAAAQKEVSDLKTAATQRVADLKAAAIKDSDELKTAAKIAHEPLEKAAVKAAERHAHKEKQAGNIADRVHKFTRGEKDLKPPVQKTVMVDGKIVKTPKVGNDPKLAAAYQKLDTAFDAVVDKSKIGKLPSYASVSGAVSAVDHASLAKAHPAFGHLEGISSESLGTEKAAPLVKKYQEAMAALHADSSIASELGAVKTAHGNLSAMEEVVDGVAKMKAGTDEAAYKAAKEALTAAQGKLDGVLKVTDKSSQAVKDFAAASADVKPLKGVRGAVKAHGVFGAIGHNFGGEGRLVMKAGRGVGFLGGLYMGYDAAMRDKTSDGQDRSMWMRFVELAGGVGVAGFSLLAGRA